jgi:UDPglucose 6-dehydrogenase
LESIEKHDVYKYDPAKKYYDDISSAEVTFLTVPTSDIEHRILSEAVRFVISQNEECLIIIRSTVKPGTTDYFNEKYKEEGREFIFVPEFLREKSAVNDSFDPDKLVIGANTKKQSDTVIRIFRNLISKKKLDILNKIVHMKPIEAEMAKIALNSLAFLKVVYANELYDICDAYKVDYSKLLEVFKLDRNINDRHLRPLMDGYRGAAGKCLRKDSAFFIDAGMKKSSTPNTLLTAQKINEIYLKDSGYDISNKE